MVAYVAITVVVLDILLLVWFHAVASHADEVWDDNR